MEKKSSRGESASGKKQPVKKSSGMGEKSMDQGAMDDRSMEQKSMLEEFFVDELKDIYWAEKHLLKVLPRMAKAATTDELKELMQEHLQVTQEQISRLEEVFEIMEKKPQAKKCEAMEGITKEGEGIVEDTEAGSLTRDVGLIMAAQKVEHYEIATYGGLAQLAKTLGREDVAELLEETLNEEKEADEKLTSIAENNINFDASGE